MYSEKTGLAAKISNHSKLLKEHSAYRWLQGCPIILQCYGLFTLDHNIMDEEDSQAILLMENSTPIGDQ
jgi:hypothetical protein